MISRKLSSSTLHLFRRWRHVLLRLMITRSDYLSFKQLNDERRIRRRRIFFQYSFVALIRKFRFLPLHTQIRPDNPFLTFSDFPSFMLFIRQPGPDQTSAQERRAMTHQHTIIPMLVQKQHSSLQPHHDLLVNRRLLARHVIGIENGLATLTACC